MPGGLRKADRRRRAGIRDADDEIRLGRRLAREGLAHAHASAVHLHPAYARIRTREIDVLEDAERVSARGQRLHCVQPSRIDPHDLAGPDVAHDVGADQVEGARLGGDDPVLADLAECERPEPERIAKSEERVVDQSRDRVRALEPAHRARDGLRQRGRVAGDERRDHLGVRARAEPYTVLHQLRAQLLDVHEVPVVTERDRARAPVMDQRLRVRPAVRAGRRVARVPDRDLSRQCVQLLLVEHLRDEAHVADDGEPAVVGDGDPGRFLAAVLKREQAEVREARDVSLLRADAEDATHLVRQTGIRSRGFQSREDP